MDVLIAGIACLVIGYVLGMCCTCLMIACKRDKRDGERDE